MAKVKLDYCNLQTIKFRFAVINVFVVSSYLRVHLRVYTSADLLFFLNLLLFSLGVVATLHGMEYAGFPVNIGLQQEWPGFVRPSRNGEWTTKWSKVQLCKLQATFLIRRLKLNLQLRYQLHEYYTRCWPSSKMA